MSWTADAIAELTQLWNSPEAPSAAVIALSMGTPTWRLSRSAIIGKAFRLGLSKRRSDTVVRKPKPRHRPVRAPKLGGRGWNAGVRMVEIPTPEPAPVDDSAIPIAQRKTIFELENRHCRWPLPGDPVEFYCAHPSANVLGGRPYCVVHTRRASAGPGRAPAPYPMWKRKG